MDKFLSKNMLKDDF